MGVETEMDLNILFEEMSFGIFLEAKSDFEKLKDCKVPLDDDERQICIKRKATWHNSAHDKKCAPHCEVPAVWKSKGKDGKMTYVTNTHRAYQSRPTLKGAISIFHKFIKGTA